MEDDDTQFEEEGKTHNSALSSEAQDQVERTSMVMLLWNLCSGLKVWSI